MTQEIDAQAGTLGRPEDAGKGEAGKVARWMLEVELASKVESRWRDAASKVIDKYRGDGDGGCEFNILWSNTEVLRPHLYGQTPKADVRRRFRDADPVGRNAAEVMERALDYGIDAGNLDGQMANVILDYLLPGRAVARVRFEPTIEGEGDAQRLAYASCTVERWPWDRFRRGPGITWEEVPWIAYEHQLVQEEVDRKFPGFGSKVQYDIKMDGVSDKAAEAEPSVFKRVRIWEIWEKVERKIYWLAPSCKEEFLLVEGDKLNLEGFFDCPKPLYAIESGSSLIPIPEFEMYRKQAEELDEVTRRINRLTKTLKQRGVYDSTLKELETLMTAADNEMIATSGGVAKLAGKGFDDAIWMMPIEPAAKVLSQLILQREQLKQIIYEIMGIGDILRGSTDPDETLGAQQLKAQTGSMRMQRRQRDVQGFVRDLLRKKAEIMAENYTPELFQLMTGIKLFPDAAARQQAQMMMQQQAMMAGQTGQQPPPPDPEMQQMMAKPTWEEVMQVLQSDLLRGFRIDIETDSTVAADSAAERQQVTELITGVGGFMQNMVPAVENQLISLEAAKSILTGALRRFKLGRNIENVLEEEEGKPVQPKPDPAMQQMQAQLQMKQQEMEMTLAAKQKEAEAGLMLKERESQAEQQRKAVQLEQDMRLEEQKFGFQMQMDEQKMRHQMDIEAGKAVMMAGIERDRALMAEGGEAGMTNYENAKSSAGGKVDAKLAEAITKQSEMIGQAIQALLEGQQQMQRALSAKKRLVRDEQGRAVGMETVMEGDE